jgi:hypothetical protein
MTPKERARALVGDMPWVTEHLTPSQLADLPKQIEACLDAAIREAAGKWPSEWMSAIREAEQEAMADEREACAKIAEKWSTTAMAKAIRARGETK